MYGKYTKYVKYYDIVVAILFFLLGATFQAIMPRRLSFIIYFCLLASQLMLMKLDKSFSFQSVKEIIDIRDVLLIVCMVSFRIANYLFYNPDLNGNIIWATVPIMLYFYGKLFVLHHNADSYDSIQRIVLPFASGLMVFGLVGMLSYYVYEHVGDGRSWMMLIVGGYPLRATFYAFYILLFVALIPWAVLTWKRNPLIKIIIILFGGGSLLWFWIVAETRSPMIVFLMALIVTVGLKLVDKFSGRGHDRKEGRRYLFIIVACLLVLILVFSMNLFGLKTAFLSSTLFRDGSLLREPRLRMMWNAISKLNEYPWGNNHTEAYKGYGTTHVYWTELAYCGGYIPFVTGVLWLILSITDAVKVVFHKQIRYEEKLFLLVSFGAVTLYSFTEGLRDMFTIFSVMLLAALIRGKVLHMNRLDKSDKTE